MPEMKLKTPEDILRIREAGRIIAEIFNTLSGMRLEGSSTLEIDRLIEDLIHRGKARPSFKTIRGYNHASCISINQEIVHGIPAKKKLIRKGDLVKIDIGTVKGGYFADSCVTFTIDPVHGAAKELARVAEECLGKAIRASNPGNRLGDIGHAIQAHAEANGFSVVRDLTGHGVGFAVHELPSVLHYGLKGSGQTMVEGMVLAIEPMINEGSPDVRSLPDGWTIETADGKLSAQFEHTVAVTSKGPVVLTAL
jgi:methionyl aminopeptidase